MIEDIKEKCAELDALITMVLDEFQGIYNCDPKNRNYELERLRNAMTIALYMIDARNKDINSLTDQIIDAEIQGGGLIKWIYRYLWQVVQKVSLGKINLLVG